MKLIVEKQGEIVKAIKAEYTPTEALVINHAMRRYACDEDVNETDRAIMERMLEVEPIRQEDCEDCISRAEAQTALMMSKDAYLYIGHPTIRISDAVQALRELPSVQPKAKAIDLLKMAVPVKALTQQEYAEFIEAVNMAIKALESEPCEDDAKRTSANYYSGRLKNDNHKAVEILNWFTKAFCIDAEEGNDLVFRCPECLFQTIDGTCLVKAFKHKFHPDYKDFGSMGDL